MGFQVSVSDMIIFCLPSTDQLEMLNIDPIFGWMLYFPKKINKHISSNQSEERIMRFKEDQWGENKGHDVFL